MMSYIASCALCDMASADPTILQANSHDMDGIATYDKVPEDTTNLYITYSIAGIGIKLARISLRLSTHQETTEPAQTP